MCVGKHKKNKLNDYASLSDPLFVNLELLIHTFIVGLGQRRALMFKLNLVNVFLNLHCVSQCEIFIYI